MSDAQARATLATCPALGQLDVRLAQRRLKQLDRQMGINRCQAALLVLRRPHTLLPPASDVVGYALEARGKRRPPGPRS